MINKVRLFRIIHIENMNRILKHGLTLPNSINANPNYISIGDDTLINARNNINTLINQKLSDFIPFYFWYKMPMLYVVQNGFNGVAIQKPQNIVYCITKIDKIINAKLPFLFTDGHAVNKLSQFYNENDLDRLNSILDFDAIKIRYWNHEKDFYF